MPLSTTSSSAPLSPLVKMEDRKRPALSATDDIAPPSKRQAVNGGSKSSKDDSDMKEEAWIEDYAKDAIYRQMQEYKRTCSTLEARLEEIERRSTHHDDHIRVVDAWWIQMLQELKILTEGAIPFQPGSSEAAFPTQTTFKDIRDLEVHLEDKASTIKGMAESIITRLASGRGQVAPNITNLESQVNNLLAQQKDFLVKIDRLSSEKNDVSDQLNTATLRYMKAERKMDRLRSTQVQKLEQQALANATTRPAGTESDNSNGESNGNSVALQLAISEITVAGAKQKEQLEAALTQSKELQEELTAVQTRMTNLTDEDYSRTEVFKLFKRQQEDLAKKINHMEVENKAFKAANKKLEEERDAYKLKIEAEAYQLSTELEDQLQQSDNTLARVRSARDELHGEVQMLKAGKEQDRTASDEMKALVSAKEDRITALQLEIQRLAPNDDVDMTPRPDIDSLTTEDLREKYKKLQKDFESINNELPAMTAAVKKYQALANKKIADFSALEDRLAVAIAEKGKANQKYFDARKTHDTLAEEVRKVRSQNGKSSEIISQLKDHESQNRTLLGNLEKQLMDLKQTNSTAMGECKRVEASSNETMRRYEALKSQVSELSSLARSKDTATSLSRERTSNLETETEKLKVRLEHTQKDRDKWKTKSLNNSSEEEEMLRKLATCSVCHNNFKDTVLKTCGHIFCRGCVDDRISNRMRKCPNCSKMFDKLDVMTVHL